MSATNSLRPLILSGPSGTGKSTLLNRLFNEYPDKFSFSISHTTRKPRPHEVHGKDYYFVERSEFERMVEENGFVEHAQFSGNYYGTSRKALADIQSTGRRPILDIDAQGVCLIKQASIEATYLFIAPPSFATLHQRLTGRGTETQESISKRLDAAIKEIKFAQTPGVHDAVVVNDSLDRAYDLFKGIALGEMLEGDRLPQYNFA